MRSGAVKRVMVLPSNLLRGGSMLALDMIQTLAAGGVALFVGFAVVRRFPVLARYNVPAAVIGGLLVALAILALRRSSGMTVTLDTSLQPALMTAFFTSIGFSAKVESPDDRRTGAIFREVEPEDLLKFGLIPEFVGRLPVVATLEDLDEPALKKILTEPKNALVKQYQKLFDLDDVELEFTPESLDAIAELALKRGTGARGLRAIMESVLLSVMYDVPSRTDVAKVVIEKACIE